MIAFLLSAFLALFLFTTFGFFITKFIKIPYSVVEKLLIGLVVCNTLTSGISLFLKINICTLVFLTLIGLFLLKFIKKELITNLISLYENKYILLCSLSFIIIAFIISLSPPINYDTGLYHLQSIKWIEEFSVVPGLANLHGRFGFNPNIFTLFALTSINDLFKQEIFSINFIVFSILVFYFINTLYSLFKQQGFSNHFLFYFFLFLIILRLPNLSSPSPDFLSTAIPLFIFSRLFELSNKKVNSEFRSYIPILVLSIYLLTIKLSTVPISLLFIFVFIKYKSELLKSLWLLPIISLIIIPWLVRNIIISGWLIYPFPSLDLFSFDWKVPIENVIGEKEAVTGWARDPGVNFIKAANLPLINWFSIWWHNINPNQRVLFGLSIISPLTLLIGQLIKKKRIEIFTNAIIITSFLGVLFWFLLAPDWRFGESFIVIASMSPLLVLKSNFELTLNPKFIFPLIFIFLISYYTMNNIFILIIVLSILLYFKSYLSPKFKTKIVFGVLLLVFLGFYIKGNFGIIKSNSYKLLHSSCLITPLKIEKPANVHFRTYSISTFKIYFPSEGDRCFDNDIPCSTFLDTTIVLRNNKLKSGFKHVLIKKR